MAEPILLWWARRQFSRGVDVPYVVGTYREAWASYPQLIRQYHPELNSGITLTQIPPAADVLLLWECEAGHRFAATPSEQRARPGGTRRRSAWCPECTASAVPRNVMPSRAPPVAPRDRRTNVDRSDRRAEGEGRQSSAADAGSPWSPAAPESPTTARRVRGTRRRPHASRICDRTPDLPAGEPFRSSCAPRPASAAEERLRADLSARLLSTEGLNAVRVTRAFHRHVEVWPDILLPELRIAIEYDTTGRFGLEHVGPREASDRQKDALLRQVGWEVVRVRTGKLPPLGPHDVQMSTVGKRGLDRLIDVLRDIRGPLMVDAYLV